MPRSCSRCTCCWTWPARRCAPAWCWSARVPAEALSAIRDAWTAVGAQTVDAPILQPLNLLLDLAGEAMRARLFVVQAEGEAESCLRPAFPAAVVGQHI